MSDWPDWALASYWYGAAYPCEEDGARACVDVHEEEAASRLEVALDAVHLDPLADIHDLDIRPLVGRDRLVRLLLVADTAPIVGDGTVGVPARIVW